MTRASDGEVHTLRTGTGAACVALKVLGALLLASGVVLGGQFLWSLRDLAREVQEAAQGEHRILALMGTLDPSAPTASSLLIGGIGAAALTVSGAVILHRAR
jgi:hypothetical protein